jgi:hypothetical protein
LFWPVALQVKDKQLMKSVGCAFQLLLQLLLNQ